jgi:hypothetical protein
MTSSTHKVRISNLQATIWRDTRPNGIWYSVNVARSCRTDDQRRETDALVYDDLLGPPSSSTWPAPGSCTTSMRTAGPAGRPGRLPGEDQPAGRSPAARPQSVRTRP